MAPSTTKRLDKYILSFILVLSFCYLTTEVAFTSYVIEFLGAPRTPDDILQIERTGRALTGFALALVFFYFATHIIVSKIGPTPPAIIIIFVVLLALTGGCIEVVRYSIESLVTYLADQTTLQDRRHALLVAAIVDRLHATENSSPVLTVYHTYVPDYLGKSNEGRVVLAALPFLMSEIPNLESQLLAALRSTLVRKLHQQLGSAEKSYNTMFVTPMHEIILPTFNGYVKAINAYRDGRYNKIHTADEQFDEYREELAQYHLNIETAKKYRRIRDKVAEKLISKNRHFEFICSRKGLPDSVSDFDEVIDLTLDDEFKNAMARMDLVGMPPRPGAYTIAQFVKEPPVVRLWATKLQAAITEPGLAERVANYGPRLGTSGLLLPGFRKDVYEPYIDIQVQKKMDEVTADVEKYTNNTSLGEEAYSTTKSLIVIPIAIVASMLGALFHTFKVTYMTMRIFSVPKFAAYSVICIAFSIILYNIQSKEFSAVETWKPSKTIATALEKNHGNFWSFAYRATVIIQSKLYPIGLEIREKTGLFPTLH